MTYTHTYGAKTAYILILNRSLNILLITPRPAK